MKTSVPLLLVTSFWIVPVWAQQGTKPAPVINIDIESIKEGKSAAHEKVETDWAATLHKAGFPANYYAVASMSGASQVWFIQPMASFAAGEEVAKFSAREPLKGALDNLDSRDGELRLSSRQLWAVYRADLSYKPETCNMAKTRYMDIAEYRIKLGKDEDFAGGVKAIFGAYAKGNVDMCVLSYKVTAGAPDGTYLILLPMNSMKFLDAEPERGKTLQTGMPESTYQRIMHGSEEVFASMEHNLFEVKPSMSLPEPAVIDADPGFWKPKTPAKSDKSPVTVPGPPEKK